MGQRPTVVDNGEPFLLKKPDWGQPFEDLVDGIPPRVWSQIRQPSNV